MGIEWTAEQSEDLKRLHGSGLSYAHIAQAINEKFGTSYSRNATIGRAGRMNLGQKSGPRRASAQYARVSQRAAKPRVPHEPPEVIAFRCAEIIPRHLSLMQLERNDCRYPYGGDSEPITFCGHPKMPDRSYCAAHFHLTRGAGTASERSAVRPATHMVAA